MQFLSNNVTGTMANLLFWKLCGTWAWWLKLMSTICVVTSASGLGFSCSSQVFVKRTGGFSVGIIKNGYEVNTLLTGTQLTWFRKFQSLLSFSHIFSLFL